MEFKKETSEEGNISKNIPTNKKIWLEHLDFSEYNFSQVNIEKIYFPKRAKSNFVENGGLQ